MLCTMNTGAHIIISQALLIWTWKRRRIFITFFSMNNDGSKQWIASPGTTEEPRRCKQIFYAQWKEKAGPKHVPPVFQSLHEVSSRCRCTVTAVIRGGTVKHQNQSLDMLHTSDSRAQGYMQCRAACKLLNLALITAHSLHDTFNIFRLEKKIIWADFNWSLGQTSSSR